MAARKKVLVFGAGGHATVVVDAIERGRRWAPLGLIDDDPKRTGERVAGYRILGTRAALGSLRRRAKLAIVAVGDNRARLEIARLLRSHGFELATIIHPAATVAPGAKLGAGSVVLAGAVVNAAAVLGENVIINTAASVDHDCVLGDGVHIAPGAHLAGWVRVGRLALVGIGASVIGRIRIGEGAIVGVGAAVIADVPDNVTVGGVPARVLTSSKTT